MDYHITTTGEASKQVHCKQSGMKSYSFLIGSDREAMPSVKYVRRLLPQACCSTFKRFHVHDSEVKYGCLQCSILK